MYNSNKKPVDDLDEESLLPVIVVRPKPSSVLRPVPPPPEVWYR